MNAHTQISEPNVGGVRVRPAWSLALYSLLVISAGVAFYAQRSPRVEPTVAQAAPWLFFAFAVGFSVYRLALVAARRYSPFKAFIQVFLASLFFLLLLLPQVPNSKGEDVILRHPDARVRAMSAELIGWRGDRARAHELVKLLEDSSAEVREAGHQALVKLNGGVDLGSPDDAASRAAWEKLFP